MSPRPRKSILFVGPLPPPVHGQSLHFMETCRGVGNCDKYVVSVNATGKSVPAAMVLVLSALARMVGHFLVRRIDIVYFTCARSRKGSLFDFLVIGLARAFGSKVVNHLHGADFRDYYATLPRAWKKIAAWFYDRIDLSIVLTEGMKDQFLPFFPRMRIEVVPNFYAREFERDVVKGPSRARELIYLSNIMESKGIFTLLEAFRRIGETFDDVKLTIAGACIGDEGMKEGEVRERFLRELETLGRSLPGKIAYLGVIRGEEKVRRLMDSDIFVLPTFYRSEAFPLSIIEAMRSGNAIVTTRHNYLPEIVSGRNGVLVEPRSSGAVEDALNGLLANGGKTREIQKHNIDEAKSRYSCERYLERISAVLEVPPGRLSPMGDGKSD